eukprot:s9449_g1.t1
MISGAPIVEVFGGMGGLRQACELLGLQPQGLVYFDTSDLGTKLVRRQCGYVLTFGDIRKVTFEDGLATLFPKSDQDGFLGAMVQLRDWIQQPAWPSLPPWELVEIYENLLLKPEATDRVTSKLRWWLKGLNLVTAGDMKLKPAAGKPTSMVFDTERPPLSAFLKPRLPPRHYVDANMVKGSSGVRRLQSDEQLRMFGFFSDHLSFKQKVSEDQRQQLIACSWPAVVAARLLVNLVLPLEEAKDRELVECQVRAGVERVNMDHFRTLGVTQSDLPVRLALDPEQKLSDEQFLAMLVGRNVSHKLGTDVRLDMGLPFVAADFGRRSVDPTLWQWKVLLSYKWKQQGHITLLESVAVLDSARPLEEVDTDGRGDKQEGDGPSRWVRKRAVSCFIEELWEDGDPKAYASDTLSGLGHFIPSVKPHLISSWRLHAAWGRSELPARAPPFTVALIYALAQLAFEAHLISSWRLHAAWGRSELPARAPPFTVALIYALAQLAFEAGWKDTAVLFVLGFHTFARSGELFSAKAGDFVLSRGKGDMDLAHE